MMHIEAYSPYPTGTMNMSSAMDVMDGVAYPNPYRSGWRCAPPSSHTFRPLDDQLLARAELANEMSKTGGIHPFFRHHDSSHSTTPSLYGLDTSPTGHPSAALRPAHQLSSPQHSLYMHSSHHHQTHQHHSHSQNSHQQQQQQQQQQHLDTASGGGSGGGSATPAPSNHHTHHTSMCSTPVPSSSNTSLSIGLPSISVASGFDTSPIQQHQQQHQMASELSASYSAAVAAVGGYSGYSSAAAAAVAAANSAAAAAAAQQHHHNHHGNQHSNPLSPHGYPISPHLQYHQPHPVHDMDYDPRELEAFAERFKQRRIKLGVTQADVGKALGNLKLTGVGSLSQSTICRFESLTLSHNNMVALKPVLQAWLEEAEMIAAEAAKNPDIYGDSADKKRKRTSITDAEKRSLEAYFAVQPRPSSEKIAQIAEKLNLKKNVVRVWFCNQRQKQKRMKFTNVMGMGHHGQVV